jgi:hypothetical protein
MKSVLILVLCILLSILNLRCTQIPQKVIGSNGAGIGLIKLARGDHNNVFIVGEGYNKYSWMILRDQLSEVKLRNNSLSLERFRGNCGVDIYVPIGNEVVQNEPDTARVRFNCSDTTIKEEIRWFRSKINASIRSGIENLVNFDQQDSTIKAIASHLAIEHDGDSLVILGHQVVKPKSQINYLIAGVVVNDEYYYFIHKKNGRMNDVNLAWFATMLQNVIINDEYVLLNANFEKWKYFKPNQWFL